MGPRLSGRGKGTIPEGAEVRRKCASMGPRLSGRGKLSLAEATQPLIQVASMGPRLSGRGKLDEMLEQPKGRGKLQWGRDYLVAESIPCTYSIGFRIRELQW